MTAAPGRWKVLAARTVRGSARAATVAMGVVVGSVLRAAHGFRRVQVQRIGAGRIGHLAIEPEILLAKRELAGRRERIYFFVDEPPANAVMMQMWLRSVRSGPAWLLSPMFTAGQRFPRLGWVPDDWDEEHVDLRPLDATAPHARLTDEEERQGERLLATLGVPAGAPFVCLAVRDSAYLEAAQPGRDWSYHSYRDSDIDTYAPMAEWLAAQGFYVVRMGRQVQNPLVSSDPRVIDYANSPLRSDLADVYLFAHCDFCISTSTGMDAVSALFRRPLGLVNLGSAGGLQLGDHVRLIMFKAIVDAETGIVLPLDDDRRLSAIWAGNARVFDESGLTWRDNTPEELTAFAQEMLALLTGTWTTDQALAVEERRFKELTSGPYDWRESDFHVSPTWLSGSPWHRRPDAQD